MLLKAGRWGRKWLGPRNLPGDKVSRRKAEGAGPAWEPQVGQKTRRKAGRRRQAGAGAAACRAAGSAGRAARLPVPGALAPCRG